MRWTWHNRLSCDVTIRGLIVFRGTIYLGVSSPLLRGQHQYPNTQHQDAQLPEIHCPNTQCPHTHCPTTNAQTLTSPASCAFFHRVHAMEGARSPGETVIIFDLTYSDTGLGCSDDYWHYGINHRGSHNHGAV